MTEELELGTLTITFSETHSFISEGVKKYIPESGAEWVEFIDNTTGVSVLVQVSKILYNKWVPNKKQEKKENIP